MWPWKETLIAALNFSDLHSQGSCFCPTHMLKLWENPWLFQANMLSSQTKLVTTMEKGYIIAQFASFAQKSLLVCKTR